MHCGERCGRAVRDGGGELMHALFAAVAGNVKTRGPGQAVLLGVGVAACIERCETGKGVVVRLMSDGDKHAVHGKRPCCAVLLHDQTVQLVFSQQLCDTGVQQELDVFLFCERNPLERKTVWAF